MEAQAGQVPFSRRVAQADWHADVTAWIDDRLQVHDLRLTGAPEQIRIRPWSTQLTVPTDAGRWWFKANCRSMALEPGLHALLAELLPDDVDPPVAIWPARGWMITADHGPILREVREPTLADWQQVVGVSARMQHDLVAHRERVLDVGLLDCSPGTVVDRFDRLCAVLEMDPELRERLATIRPRLVDAAATLANSALPATWQHGDLHPGNVYEDADGTGIRLFDFGDSQWAHALEALVVPYSIVTHEGLPWEPIFGACAEAWGLQAADLADDWDAIALTHCVNRALTWAGCLAEATAAEWIEWDDAPVETLARLVDR